MWSKKKTKSAKKSNASEWLKEQKATDSAWSAMAKRKLGMKCYKPGCTKTTSIQAHHVINDRRCFSTRYEPSNALCLCAGHHRFWAEMDCGREEARKIIREIIGDEEYERIASLKNVIVKRSKLELRQLRWELNHMYLEKERINGK